MRSLVLLVSLCAVAALAEDRAALEERREALVAAASETAAGMGGFEEYAPYITPFPNRLLKGEELVDYLLFAEGWSNIEAEGIWSDGESSRFFLRVDPDKRPQMLYIHGRYYGEEEGTLLFVNGQQLSNVPLVHQKIALPDSIERGAPLDIELRHHETALVEGEAKPGQGPRRRRVKFFLVGLEVW